MTALGKPRLGSVSTTLASNKLGVFAVVCFILTATTPLTVTSAVFPTGVAVTGLVGIPLAFVVIGLVLLLWAPDYVAMGRQIGNAGAFYSYVTHGLGRPLGVAAAWVAVAAYNALQVGLYGAVGVAVGPLLSRWTGWNLAWWVIALAAWALVAVLGLMHVDINGKVLAVLLLAEIAIIVIYAVANLANPAGGSIIFDSLNPGNLMYAGAALGAGLGLAMLGFVGIEGGVVYSEESRNPLRTVPLATFVALVVTVIVYTLSSWSQSVAVGPDRLVDTARTEGPEMFFNLAGGNLGSTMVDIGRVLFATSIIAAMISFHNACSRYTFALGREGVIPRLFGRTGRRSNAPIYGSLAQTMVGIAVIVTYAASGWDPLVHLFFWGGTSGGIGILLLITATAISVTVFFARRGRRTLLATIASGLLLIISYLALAHLDVLLGVPPGSPVVAVVPVAVLALTILGVAWGLYLRATNRAVYNGIGLGAKSVLTAAPGPLGDTGQVQEARR